MTSAKTRKKRPSRRKKKKRKKTKACLRLRNFSVRPGLVCLKILVRGPLTGKRVSSCYLMHWESTKL